MLTSSITKSLLQPYPGFPKNPITFSTAPAAIKPCESFQSEDRFTSASAANWAISCIGKNQGSKKDAIGIL